jgi:NodT family efflux transporter outer membrane factor (OMF) lipoprotein
VSATELNWHAARTSLAAEVANTYVAYRACQALSAALLADVASREETARLTGLLVNAGFTAPAEGFLADASAANGRQQQIAIVAECELDVKSMVALTGLPEPETRTLLDSSKTQPAAPAFSLTALPVQVISQRPDVAAAERTLAAASAQINVAQANRLPRLALLGNISFFGVKLSGSSTQVNSKTWSVGPSVSLPIFDAGLRAAQADVAKANYAEALAAYEQTVAQAVREVESALVSVDAAQKRRNDAQTAKNKFDQFFNASLARHNVGSASLLELEDARRNRLSAEQNLINLKSEYTTSWIALYKAVGGSWLNQTSQTNLVNQTETP